MWGDEIALRFKEYSDVVEYNLIQIFLMVISAKIFQWNYLCSMWLPAGTFERTVILFETPFCPGWQKRWNWLLILHTYLNTQIVFCTSNIDCKLCQVKTPSVIAEPRWPCICKQGFLDVRTVLWNLCHIFILSSQWRSDNETRQSFLLDSNR